MIFPASDEKLISKALGGSQGSWLNIVRRYEGLIYNYCLRMTGNASDAMDLMQEVFLSVYRHLPSYQGRGQFKAWMMRIAANKSIDFLRTRSRNPQHQSGPADESIIDFRPAPENSNPDIACERHSHNRQIQKLMNQLPADQKLVVEMKFFQHYTFDEISQQTGIPVNTVKSRLYAALEKMKHQTELQHVM